MAKDRSSAIRYLFEPRSIAIIGASANRGKIGHSILNNVLAGGYRGAVYPINPAGGDIEGTPVYRRISDAPGPIDVACITIPAKMVFEAVKECCEKRIKYAVIISSGFSEIGNVEEERKIADYARSNGLRIVGPNVFGIYSASARLNATFAPGSIVPGNLGIITQSGALGLAMIGQTAVDNIGLSSIISVGNKSDVDEADLLEYLIDQRNTRAVLMYVEGIRDGEKLIKSLTKATREKPVVFIKSGRSARGAMAAASHTGSLAGSDEVFDDIARQCGALRAESIREAFNWCKFLAGNPLPAGDDAVIITNGGGAGVMATDACEKYDVRLYDDLEALRMTFAPATPDFGSTRNPIDITGQATAAEYAKAFAAALKNKNIHAVVGLYCETALFNAESLAEVIEQNYEQYKSAGKPILFTLLGGVDTSAYETRARRKGIPVSNDIYESVSSLGAMFAYKRHISQPAGEHFDTDIDVLSVEKVIANARRAGRYFLLSHEAQSIMTIAGISIPKSLIALTLEDAVKSAAAIGYPVVMKIISRDIIHKSDAGGIAVDLDNREEVIDAYGAIIRNCRAYAPNAVIEGIEIAEMVKPGIEMIVGARIDGAFGPIVMAGLGGIYVEVMKDVSFRAVPLTHRDMLSMIREIRSYPLLLGVRGEKMKDIDKIVDTIAKLGAIVSKCRGISDIEINPLIVYEQGLGVKAVDVRIILARE